MDANTLLNNNNKKDKVMKFWPQWHKKVINDF